MLMNMMKTTNLPAGLELLSDEETFLDELVNEQDYLVNYDICVGMSASIAAISQPDEQPKMSVYICNSQPQLWLQRTVNINCIF
jgi:hypothetical protein